MTDKPFSPKQLEFIVNSTAKWNLAHGSVRSGKTICTLWRFLQAVYECRGENIAMIGHTATTIYQNAVRLIMESPTLEIYRPFCTWFPSKRELHFKNKVISTIGAKDEGAYKIIQGRTLSLAYCDEMTLYPDNIIDVIDTRLSLPESTGFASMNPTHPRHKIKSWIDRAEDGDPNYYSLHFTLDDNPFLEESYKRRIKNSVSGVFYKRNYLGLWCLAEGAVFDFFEKDLHVVKRPPCAAEYWIAGIDFGTANPFACVLIGVNTGKYIQSSKRLWVEKEYYWDPKKEGRQKTNSEFAEDVKRFLEDYAVKAIYLDPSAEAFQLELRRVGLHPVHANNSVFNGLQMLSSEIGKGSLVICDCCPNLIREMESYVWDPKSVEDGEDEPIKKNDHAIDALRYAIASHKVSTFDLEEYERKHNEYVQQRAQSHGWRPYR